MSEPEHELPTTLEAENRAAIREFIDRVRSNAPLRAKITRYATIAWIVTLLLLVAWVIFRGRDDLAATYNELKSADLRWIAVAILIQALMLVFSGLTYKLILRRLGHGVPLRKMVDAHMQRTTISTVTPGGGPASIFMFARYASTLGVPYEDGFLTVGVRSLGVAVTFIAVLIPGAAIGRSWPGAIVAAVGTIALVIAGIALWKGEKDDWQTPLAWSERLPSWASGRIQGFIIRFRDHGLKPVDLVPPIVLALLVRFTILGVLWACLLALGEHPSGETMLNTYFASILASTAVPVFGGGGAVEAVSILTLTQSGISSEIAIGATLIWRLIDLWIPVGIGLVLHARMELPNIDSAKASEVARASESALGTNVITPDESESLR